MSKSAIIALGLISSMSAMASYDLAVNGKQVTCYGEDNASIILNAKRTTLKFVSEGESLGAKKIVKKRTDNHSYASYTTVEGTLVLSNDGDYSFYEEDTAQARSYFRCK